jgi:trimeric autotransporter adhesin
MTLKKWGLGWSLLAVVCSMTFPALAQDSAAVGAAATSTANGAVPGLMNYNGVLKDANGKLISTVTGATFLLYKDEQGGAPLWIETQNITPDKSGRYTVTLGATKADGSLADSFANGEARWLGVQIEGQAEQARVLLVAVPYALKAGDAQTIGGLPASAFMLANGNKTAATSTARGTTSTSPATKSSAPPANPAVTGKGVLNFIPMWDTTSDIVDSILFQKNSQIGINTTAPAATLDVSGKTDVRDTLTLFPKSTDNTVAISGTTFKIDSTGKVTFISGQTFPGTGTITGITTASGSGLSGGGTTGTLSLKVASAGITNAMLQNSKVTLNANTAGGITTPGAMTLGNTYTIGLKACSANQVLQYSGTTWLCKTLGGTGTVTSVGSGAGLTGGPITTSGTLSIASAGVTNTMLQHSSLTVAAGTDLTGGGSVALGGTTTLNLDTTKVPQLNAANSFVGNQAVIGNLSATSEVSAGSTPTGNVASGTVEVDAAAVNNGSWSPALNFGGGGEVIASDRTGSANQYGIDFFTAYTPRLSITNTGLVGIGVQSPGWMLEVDPPNDTRIFGSAIFGSNDTGSGEGASYALYAAGGYDITNISFNSAGLGGFLVGGSSNVGFGGDGLDAWAGSGALANGYAGFFSGDVYVSGNLSKGGGSFKIDHPLDPANKYLYHSFVESPDMMNIYNGNVMLDANGEAVIELPEWFGSLNRDYRYQLTCIGGFAPVYVAEEISNNQFKIAGGKSGMKISWQVTGVRQDAWANAHRIPVEVQKPDRERGYYLHPELYGAPEEKNVEWSRHPDAMQRMKARQAKLAAQPKQR